MASGLVFGVREAMKALSKVDPVLRRETQKRMRRAAEPLRVAIRAQIPSDPPMSGWERGRYAFDGAAAKRGVRPRYGGRARGNNAWPLLTMTQSDAGGAVFDMAGRASSGKSPQGRQFIANLRARSGQASRSMWRGVEGNLDAVVTEARRAVEDMKRQIESQL